MGIYGYTANIHSFPWRGPGASQQPWRRGCGVSARAVSHANMGEFWTQQTCTVLAMTMYKGLNLSDCSCLCSSCTLILHGKAEMHAALLHVRATLLRLQPRVNTTPTTR